MRSTITKIFVEIFRRKALLRLLIAALGAAAFASCTQNGNLIYLNIQKVTKTTTSSTIPLNITVTSIVNVGSANSAAPYYVAAGKIYNGTIPSSSGSTNWSAINVPQNSGADMLCNALTWDGTYLWGGFFTSSGSTFGLYRMIPSAGAWSQVIDTLHPNTQVASLSYSNGYLFVTVSALSSGNPVYQLDAYNGSAWTATGLVNKSRPITGAAFVSGRYFAASGGTLYTSTDLTFGTTVISSSPASSPQTDSNDIMRTIFVDTGYSGGLPLIIVPSSNQTTQAQGIGNIYYSKDGGATWSKISTTSGTSYNVGFLSVAGPVDSHSTYLLGSDSGLGSAFGFFSFVPGTGALNRYSGISYSLYASAVSQILVDTTNNLVAMGTINNGLWLTIGVDPTGGFGGNTWTQE